MDRQSPHDRGSTHLVMGALADVDGALVFISSPAERSA
ncbi:hypothetical protein A7982_12502 [Minicystis rosea]|nr:hypothetical protein A7982_12502 [Minicystis rosea]